MPTPVPCAEDDELAVICFALSRGWTAGRTARTLKICRMTYYRRLKAIPEDVLRRLEAAKRETTRHAERAHARTAPAPAYRSARPCSPST